MTFAQALARIEELQATMVHAPVNTKLWTSAWVEQDKRLKEHVDSIVQLWKVAAQIRDAIAVQTADENWPDANWPQLVAGCIEFDKLMNGHA